MRERVRDERGAAVADVVLVMVLLIPLVLGILQVALVLHVRNVVASAAAEGARHAALAGSSPEAGVARTRSQIDGAVSSDLIEKVKVDEVVVDGAPAYRVTVSARVPALGLGGPSVGFSVSGSAVRETEVASWRR